jgi:hypothetical protein
LLTLFLPAAVFLEGLENEGLLGGKGGIVPGNVVPVAGSLAVFKGCQI